MLSLGVKTTSRHGTRLGNVRDRSLRQLPRGQFLPRKTGGCGVALGSLTDFTVCGPLSRLLRQLLGGARQLAAAWSQVWECPESGWVGAWQDLATVCPSYASVPHVHPTYTPSSFRSSSPAFSGVSSSRSSCISCSPWPGCFLLTPSWPFNYR